MRNKEGGVLVTGCTGYIGSRLCKVLLDKGYSVRGLIPRFAAAGDCTADPRMEAWVGDITDIQSLVGIGDKIHTVYHLAGKHTSEQKMRQLYVEGTRNLIAQMKAETIRAFIHVGNGTVYAGDSDALLDEEAPIAPTHPYGVISAEVERLLREAPGLPAVLLRVAEVYGPGQYNTYAALKTTGLTMLGNGGNYQSRIHIDDLISILVLAMHGLEAGQAYNIADERSMRQNEYFQALEERAQRSIARVSPEQVPPRALLGIHGLRMLSIRMSSVKMRDRLSYTFQYPDAIHGLDSLVNDFEEARY